MSRGANAPPPSAAACPPRRLAGDTQADAEFGQGKLPTPTHSPTFARSRDRSPHRRKSRPPPTPFISSRSRSQIRSVPRAAALPPSIPCPKWTIPLPSLPFLPSPLLYCRLACFRALTSELIISRSAAFLIAVVSPRLRRQSIDQASTTRSPSPTHRPSDAAGGRLAPVAAATIIFVLIWEEKSRGRKRRTEESSGGGPRTCDPPLVDRTWYLETSNPLLRWR